MSLSRQKVALAALLGIFAMATSYLLALYVDAAGSPTAARALLWPAELAGWAGSGFVVVTPGYDQTGQMARGIAGFVFGFPLGALIYSGVAYMALQRWWKT